MSFPRTLVRTILTWPVESQQKSRRNALIASTELTQRRREREDVEDFLAAHACHWSAPATSGLARSDVI